MAARFIAQEAFKIPGRVVLPVVGHLVEGQVEPGTLLRRQSGEEFRVVGIEFPTPRTEREGLTTILMPLDYLEQFEAGDVLEA